MKVILLLIALGFMTGCGRDAEAEKGEAVKTEAENKPAQKEFQMYEMSEMAALMEQMYVDNQRLKERITNGDTIGSFPTHFMRIHEAAMTEESDNDAFFKEQAAKFLKAQELIYKDPENAKAHFNNAVASCITCHEEKCGGPIPRIKKLYIQ